MITTASPRDLDPARPEAIAQQTFGRWTQALDAEHQTAAFGAWACAWRAWGDYLSRLASCSSPLAAFDAGAQLVTDGLNICSVAAAARLRDGGVRTPLLNDA